jgi:hypothetical protein
MPAPSELSAALDQLSEQELIERGLALRQVVRAEKVAVRRHKDNLHAAATALCALEEHCRRFGIRLIVMSSTTPKA